MAHGPITRFTTIHMIAEAVSKRDDKYYLVSTAFEKTGDYQKDGPRLSTKEKKAKKKARVRAVQEYQTKQAKGEKRWERNL